MEAEKLDRLYRIWQPYKKPDGMIVFSVLRTNSEYGRWWGIEPKHPDYDFWLWVIQKGRNPYSGHFFATEEEISKLRREYADVSRQVGQLLVNRGALLASMPNFPVPSRFDQFARRIPVSPLTFSLMLPLALCWLVWEWSREKWRQLFGGS